MPSSSMSANAAVSWSRVQTSTERPRNSPPRPPKQDPPSKAPKVTVASAPERKRSERFPAALIPSQSEQPSLCGIFVKLDELAQGYREAGNFGGSKWVYSQRIFEPGDDDCHAQRIKS